MTDGEGSTPAGIGTDVLYLPRIRRIVTGSHSTSFIERTFTAGEIARAEGANDRVRYFATRFAAKEAVFKSLGTVWGDDDDPRDIEIDTSDGGRPTVRLHGRLGRIAAHRGIVRIGLSISQDGDYVVAVALPLRRHVH